jgi:hypothetical protein
LTNAPASWRGNGIGSSSTCLSLTGSGNNPITLEELQIGPPNQPDLAELLIQINQNIAPQYEDQSGDFLATLDTAQLMSMMARFENAEAAIQGAYLQPVVQTGTIANYNLDGSPTAGGVAYGTGPALAVSAAGTLGQVLTSGGAGAPTWATDAGGTVTAVSVVSANGLAGGATPAISMPAATTSVNGYLTSTDWTTFNNKGSGTVTSVAALTLGTTGTDLSSTVANGTTTPVITLQVPTASASNRGALSSTDWTTFNSKGNGTVTTVSFTGGIVTVANPTTTPAFTIAGTSGGIPYFSSASTWASSAALAAGSLVLGGGAGATPATTATGTGVVTALGVNTGTAGAFVVNGGALGTPSSGTVTNLTGTASININGTVGATTPATGAFTTLSATGAIVATETTSSLRLILNNTTPVTGKSIELNSYSNGSLFIGQSGIANWANFSSTGLAVTGTLSATGVVTFSNYGAGTATFSAAGVISSVSDETWKIKDGIPTDPDAMLKKLEPGYWYYNDEKKEAFGADRQLGFYAQNVNAAIGPEAAPEPEEGKPWGYYDRSVLAITVMSLQKALATIEKLSARLEAKQRTQT